MKNLRVEIVADIMKYTCISRAKIIVATYGVINRRFWIIIRSFI